MLVVRARNVHEALPRALALINGLGVERDSRNGPVLQVPEPVTTVYQFPTQRVIFWPERDANPFFHFFESLWMLAGRNDVAYPARFSSNIRNYSDDGKIFNGAYGYRWRVHFRHDQLFWVIAELQKDKQNRRVVLGMWDPANDITAMEKGTKDVPCNLAANFQINPSGELDMTVFNRSNDIVWGCYGANAVHFSMLQEFVAAMVGVPVGRYWQVSNNWHGYLKTLNPLGELINKFDAGDPYSQSEVAAFPMVSSGIDPKTWLEDLKVFLVDGPIVGLREKFFRRVATPMHHAFAAYKRSDDPDRFDAAREILAQCEATDWKRACIEWIDRREIKYRKAADDGVQHDSP